MISHDINIAAKYSDKIILMREGSIYAMGAPNEVITSDNLRTVYGVTAEITKDDDAPHVILKDALPMDEDEIELDPVIPGNSAEQAKAKSGTAE